MWPDDLIASWQPLAVVLASTVGVYLGLIAFSRIAGLRSFSQMTNFDLAATVAFGSMAATTAISPSVPLAQGLVGLAVLFAVQALVARLRRIRAIAEATDSRPLLLMRDAEVLPRNLAKAQMTINDLRSKLRLAGVTRVSQVGAVTLETTGEVSVLLVDPDGDGIDAALLSSIDSRDGRASLRASLDGA